MSTVRRDVAFDATGLQLRRAMFRSQIDWRGFEPMTRVKSWVVQCFGGNRPSAPFFGFEMDGAEWLEVSR